MTTPQAFGVMDALTLPPRQWLVDKLVIEKGITLIYAEPKIGKSYIAMNMAETIATGREWLGRKTKKSNVLWIDFDMGHDGTLIRSFEVAQGINEHFENFNQHYFDNFQIITSEYFKVNKLPSLNFFTGSGISQLQQHITDNGINLIVLDTLSKIIIGANENDAKDLNIVFNNIKMVRDNCRCGFIIIHHSTKKNSGTEQSARGSGVILAEPDLILNVSRDTTDQSYIDISVSFSRYTSSFDTVQCQQQWIQCLACKMTGNPLVDAGIEMLYDSNGNEKKRYVLEERGLDDGTRRWRALKFQLLQAIAADPGIARGSLRAMVKGKNQTIDDAIAELVREGQIIINKTNRKSEHYTKEDWDEIQNNGNLAPLASTCPDDMGKP